jgi:rRNA maturation endonuclease Nob1
MTYHCEDCGNVFAKPEIVGFSVFLRAEFEVCPSCGSENCDEQGTL